MGYGNVYRAQLTNDVVNDGIHGNESSGYIKYGEFLYRRSSFGFPGRALPQLIEFNNPVTVYLLSFHHCISSPII